MLYIFILLIFSLTTYGQKRQGYIEFEKVLQTLPYYVTEKKKLDVKTNQLQDSLNAIMKDYQDFLIYGLPHNIALDSANKVILENKIRIMEKKIHEFQHYAQLEITKGQKTIKATSKDIVIKELEKYCAEKHIVCALKKKDILYCTVCYDFTDDFLDFLNRKN